jgi:hypothetical protein
MIPWEIFFKIPPPPFLKGGRRGIPTSVRFYILRYFFMRRKIDEF